MLEVVEKAGAEGVVLDNLEAIKRRVNGVPGVKYDLGNAGWDSVCVYADGRVFPQEGRIKRTLNQVDPRTGTLQLQADFPNPDGLILAGQFGRVRARVREEKNAVLVPQRAVVELQGAQSVMVVGPENKVAQRTVSMGDRIGEMWIATQGLKPGDRVVVEGIQKARPGTVVNAQVVPLPAIKDELPGPLFKAPPPSSPGQRR